MSTVMRGGDSIRHARERISLVLERSIIFRVLLNATAEKHEQLSLTLASRWGNLGCGW